MKRIILEIFCNPEKRSIKRDSHLHFLRESILGHLSFIEFGPIYRSYLENGRRYAYIRWIPVFEMRCYRRLLNISYKDHVTNEEVRRKIQAAIGEYDELLTLVKKRKLRWFGHVSRSSGLAKTILQGTVKGKRKKRQTEEAVGRQYQRVDRNGLCQLN